MGGELIMYADLLHEIKKRIRHAQVQAVLSANKEMILLYWDIGFSIAKRQIAEGWGAAIIPRLAKDIKNDMPEIKGFSERNLKRMVRFYREYPFLSEFVPQAVAQLETATANTKVPHAVALLSPEDREQMRHLVVRLPWGHNILLIEKIKDLKIRLWYMRTTIEEGWSRNVLNLMINSDSYGREGNAITNFDQMLPSPQSDLAQQALKDPPIFDFLTLDEPFRPEYAGKMNFYLNVVDDRLKHETDNLSIGMILCQDKKKILAEYALRGVAKPIGVSEYELTRALPDKLKSALPTIEEIEEELSIDDRGVAGYGIHRVVNGL